ncbi:MAG: NAD(P)/FAD-dependent oxidoreductase [Flavobacteriales bacterium]|nr:NAD(P)/FAD-dependent oxidoreductase [Flavobacteriales bacterium]
MPTGTPFKRLKKKSGYDAIVIGSGLGAMTFGAIMAKQGKKILLLEKHYVPGGFTHIFKRKEYEWDVGIHYVGDVHHDFTFMSLLFDHVTDHQLEWQEMDEVYDRIILGNNTYDFRSGKENFVEMLYEKFPGEEDAIDTYIATVYRSAGQNKKFFQERAFPALLSKLFGSFYTKKYYELSDRTTSEVLDEITDNKELKAVLAGQYGDHGMPPGESSFAIQAVVNKHYWKGGAFPIGGCQRIAETIIPVIEKAGGAVAVRAGVEKIIVKNGKATGVLMEDGSILEAPMIVSGAGYLNTMGRLLDKEVQQQIGYSPSKGVPPSVSHVCLYIGLKHNLRNLGIGSTNYWVYPHNDHDRGVREYMADPDKPFPITYISFPSLKDPEWENRYPGKSTIEMITLAPYQWFEKWEDERWKHRGEEYEAYKEKIAQRLLKELYRQFPQLEGKIDYYELSTPLSTKHFVNYEHGEIYGLDHSPARFRMKELRPKTPIKNLYLTGQDIVTVGIGGALMSGLLTAAHVTSNFRLADRIVKTVLKEREEMKEVTNT